MLGLTIFAFPYTIGQMGWLFVPVFVAILLVRTFDCLLSTVH
jgi:hypothetical protein